MNLTEQFNSQNMGLPQRMKVVDGKIALVGGKEKVDDNVSMLLSFVGWFRIFSQDYVINPYEFLQNTTSYLYRYKNILRLQIMSIGRKYLPFAKFRAVDVPIDYANRKDTTIFIEFGYNLGDVEEYKTVKKVII